MSVFKRSLIERGLMGGGVYFGITSMPIHKIPIIMTNISENQWQNNDNFLPGFKGIQCELVDVFFPHGTGETVYSRT